MNICGKESRKPVHRNRKFRRVGARGWGREAEVQLFQDEVLLKMGFPTMRIYIIRPSKMGKTGHGMCF